MSSLIQHPWQAFDYQASLSALQQAQSFCFVGPAGWGKRDFLLSLAAGLLCQNAAPCGTCQNCQWVIAGTHPDVYQLDVSEGIAAVRTAIDFAMQTAAHYRVIVVPDVTALGVAAQNALLKRLEEPGAQVRWLLSTHTPVQLLPTIKSRCQMVTLKIPAAISEAQDDEIATLCLKLAAGGPLKAQTWVDNYAQWGAKWLAALLTPQSALQIPQDATLGDMLYLWQVLVRDMLHLGWQMPERIILKPCQDKMTQLGQVEPKTWVMWARRLQAWQKTRQTQPTNAKWLIKSLWLEWADTVQG